jgi:hypothetical protein
VVVNVGAARGAGGVEGVAKVVGAAWEVAELGEAGDEAAVRVLVVGPPTMAV